MSVARDFDDESVAAVIRFLTLLGKNSEQVGADLRAVLGEEAPENDELEAIIKAIKEGATLQDEDGSSSDGEDEDESYDFEHKVLYDMVMHDDKITHSAIISLEDAHLRAAAPKGFKPDRKGLKNIADALKGDTAGIAEKGIYLGCGTRKIIPAKLEPGVFIHGSDGRGGGSSICKSKVCVLILIYRSSPSHVTRMAREVAEYMEDRGH